MQIDTSINQVVRAVSDGSIKKLVDILECMVYDNTKLKTLVELINQRDDVTDDCRTFIVEVLEGKKGTH